MEGDIAICAPYSGKLARKAGEDLKLELKRLIVHGILHIYGLDHANAAQERRMFSLQEKILARLLI